MCQESTTSYSLLGEGGTYMFIWRDSAFLYGILEGNLYISTMKFGRNEDLRSSSKTIVLKDPPFLKIHT